MSMRPECKNFDWVLIRILAFNIHICLLSNWKAKVRTSEKVNSDKLLRRFRRRLDNKAREFVCTIEFLFVVRFDIDGIDI